ncbi:hypothetical protein VTL71DRAFT_10828 [Oculimacula yallundae]|uniref:CCHC-type domain-containing protein n=1 Tax=Oculimacula yallundae TaxID=86028 RepID=A0ABR4CV87_9HELO
MAEASEPAEVAEMRNTQDDIISEQEVSVAQSTDQAMAVPDDMDLDSRTSLAGRKRNLQETYHDNEVPADGEEDGERSRKRVKDHQESPLVQEDLTTNVISPSTGGALPSMVDLDTSRQSPASEPPAESSEKGKASAAAFNLVGKSFNVQGPANAPIVVAHTWNGGVSSGLRTSFGARPRVTLDPKSTPSGIISEQETLSQLVDRAGGNSIASAMNVKPHSAAPFRELSKAEQDSLSGEEKSLYLKSLFAQLRTAVPTSSAAREMLPQTEPSSADTPDEEIEKLLKSRHKHKQTRPLQKPKPVAKLNHKQKKNLSLEDRVMYMESYEGYQREKAAWSQQQAERKEERRQRKAANTDIHADKPPRRTPAEKAADRAASIIAEFKDWVIDDDGKQADLLERFPRRRNSTKPDMTLPDENNLDLDAGIMDDVDEVDVDMNTNTNNIRQTTAPELPTFQWLKRHELSLLTQEERDAYYRTLECYTAALNNEKRQNKRQAVVTTAPEPQNLAETEIQEERQIVLDTQPEEPAIPTNDREHRIQLATQRAEAAIASNFPNDDKVEILASMAQGKTLYRSKISRPAKYTNKYGEWDLPDLLTADGIPLQLHEITFNKFAPYFLSLYPDSWPIFTQKMLTAAFNMYITDHYSHLSGKGQKKCRATATAPYAITIKKAKELANQVLGRPMQTEVSQPSLEIMNRSRDLSTPAGVSSQAPSRHENGDVDMAMEDEADVASVPDEAMEIIDHPIDDEGPIDLDVRQAELYLQQRYYPSSDLSVLRCLACGQAGHKILSCPSIKCGVCGTSGVHSEAMCPRKRRCSKCRERGHQAHECKEKLALPKSEMSCDICQSSDHLEMACHYVWRSFCPSQEEILTVRDILVDCYTCGSSGHFGPECGLHRGAIYSGGITWSKHNLEKYLDPSTQNPMPPVGVRPIAARASSNGMATDPIYIDDSDDEPSFARGAVLTSHPNSRSDQSFPSQPKLNANERRKLERQEVAKEKKLAKMKEKRNQKKEKGKPKAVHNLPNFDPNYNRNPNPPRESRPVFMGSTYKKPLPNAPSGPRDNGNNNAGSMNRGGNASRGGAGQGGRGGAAGLSKADRRRMADQAGARATRDGF